MHKHAFMCLYTLKSESEVNMGFTRPISKWGQDLFNLDFHQKWIKTGQQTCQIFYFEYVWKSSNIVIKIDLD